MRKLMIVVLLMLMLLPLTVSAETLETVDVYVEISAIGGHYDLNFDIIPDTDIGGIMNVENYGECIMFLMNYEQYQPYSEQTIITEIPLPGDYTYMVQRDYSQGPIEWNYTVSSYSNWYFVFYKAGGSLSNMIINASIWDWNFYYTTTVTYPSTNTTFINTTTVITTIDTSTSIIDSTSYIPIQDILVDPYLVGLLTIGIFGVILVFIVMRSGNKVDW